MCIIKRFPVHFCKIIKFQLSPVNGSRRTQFGYLYDGNGERSKRRVERKDGNATTTGVRVSVSSAKRWRRRRRMRARGSPSTVRFLSTVVRPVGRCCCCSAASGSPATNASINPVLPRGDVRKRNSGGRRKVNKKNRKRTPPPAAD
uniref:Uncharacterized protein n=1 Tax=Sipha flava TaxID=143950 RepID=A0A2S2QTM3_9HEMI